MEENKTEQNVKTKKQPKTEQIGFFKRLKKAIFELEDYGFFLGEKLTVAFKYFFVLMFLVSIIFSLTVAYKSSSVVNTGYNYLVNEMPEFEFKDGGLNFKEVVKAYDHDYGFSLIADTTENLQKEKIKEYKEEIYKGGNYGVLLLKNELIMIASGNENTINYSEYITSAGFNSEEVIANQKQDFINFVDQLGIQNVFISMFVILTIVTYISNIIVVLSDVCIVAIFGWFAARICGVNFKMNPMIALSIYGLSLSIVLDLIFDVIYIMTGFTVQYFEIIYLLIAYVYIIAAIFMIKYDLIKHTEELKKIIEVQKQVQKDLEHEKLEKINEENEEKETEEENKIKDKKEEKTEEKPEENRDPDGSEI